MRPALHRVVSRVLDHVGRPEQVEVIPRTSVVRLIESCRLIHGGLIVSALPWVNGIGAAPPGKYFPGIGGRSAPDTTATALRRRSRQLATADDAIVAVLDLPDQGMKVAEHRGDCDRGEDAGVAGAGTGEREVEGPFAAGRVVWGVSGAR